MGKIALTTKEVKEQTGLPRRQIEMLREAGKIRGRKIGKAYFYSVESIKAFFGDKI